MITVIFYFSIFYVQSAIELPSCDKVCITGSSRTNLDGSYHFLYFNYSIRGPVYYNVDNEKYLHPYISDTTSNIQYLIQSLSSIPTGAASSSCDINSSSSSRYAFDPYDCFKGWQTYNYTSDIWVDDAKQRLVNCNNVTVTGSDKVYADGTYAWLQFDLARNSSIYYCEECDPAYLSTWSDYLEWQIGPNYSSPARSNYCKYSNTLSNAPITLDSCGSWKTWDGSQWNSDDDMTVEKNQCPLSIDITPSIDSTIDITPSIDSNSGTDSAWIIIIFIFVVAIFFFWFAMRKLKGSAKTAQQLNVSTNKESTKTAQQLNVRTTKARTMRRVGNEPPQIVVNYPKWWKISAKHLHLTLVMDYAKPTLVTLDLNTYPGKDVVANFRKTIKDRKVVKVESVENMMLYDSYWNARAMLIKLIGENNLNERDVFHGASDLNVMKKIETEGFRKEFTKKALYGEGTYFARDASYSVGFSCSNNGVNQMFQCKVMMGESIHGKKEYKLTSWPKRSNGLMYDSLVDKVENPTKFVIHENNRAYPMFIVHFT